MFLRMKRIFTLVISVFITLHFCAAKAPIKFGKVDIEDLKMTVYEPDTSAVAVVLCKYGYFNANDFRFTTITRVKILKKEGTSLSEFSFPGKESMQVRAKVFNLENGEVVDEKVKNESIFKLKITDDVYQMQIALPNVKVGSVYDVETSQTLLPADFTFQREIPVKYCELVLEEAPEIEFRKRSCGFGTLEPKGSNTWVAKDMPAFKSEPYMDSRENYVTKFEFDILRINVPGYYKSFTTSWEAVNDRLEDHIYFGGALTNGSAFLNDIKKEIELKPYEPYEKMVAAYEAIKVVKWNKYESLYASEPNLGGVFKDKKGNAGEINMMLYLLLQKLDFNCSPVAMSTRENGRLNPFYPSLEKLNYMIVHVKLGDEDYLLDATEKFMPADMLPKRCLNKSGRLITRKSGAWVDLKTDKIDKEVVVYDLKLSEELDAEGTMECEESEYAAFDFRKDYSEYASDEEYVQDFEMEHSGLRVKGFNLTDIDSIYKPVKEEYDVKISNVAQRVGDMVMFNPLLFEQVKDNPFKLEDRKYPVDFAYKLNKVVMSTIAIPDGYEFSTLPKSARFALPEKAGAVTINYSTIGNKLTVMYSIQINKDVFSYEEYPYLKQLYAMIIDKHAEPVVIKKNQDEASL
jgi:hypothetical protein